MMTKFETKQISKLLELNLAHNEIKIIPEPEPRLSNSSFLGSETFYYGLIPGSYNQLHKVETPEMC